MRQINSHNWASLPSRSVAVLVDAICASVVYVIALIIFAIFLAGIMRIPGFLEFWDRSLSYRMEKAFQMVALNLLYLSSWIVYFSFLPAWNGDTVGTKLLGIEVVDAKGQKAPPKTLAMRSLLFWFSGLIVGIGLIWALFDPQKQTLHDRWTGTWVVNKR